MRTNKAAEHAIIECRNGIKLLIIVRIVPDLGLNCICAADAVSWEMTLRSVYALVQRKTGQKLNRPVYERIETCGARGVNVTK